MLMESKGVAQQSGEGRKRWFSDQDMELIVWLDAASQVDAFQLCYDLRRDERVFSWSRAEGFGHSRVDSGEQKPTANRAPSMGAFLAEFDAAGVAMSFRGRAERIEPGISEFVLGRILECVNGIPVKRRAAGVTNRSSGPSPSVSAPRSGATPAHPGAGAARGGGRSAAAKPVESGRPAPMKVAAPLLTDEESGPAALPDELIKKVKRIEITTRKVVTEVMSGQYRTHFKGHGVQFSEHRVYNPGDDVRHIDWKVSARSKELLLKKFEEERELTVFLVVDISGSERFGSSERLKSEVTAEVAAMLSYAAVQTGDKVGVLLFAGEIEKIIPPKKGRQHVLRVVRELLAARPRTRGTDLASALDAANRIMKHAGIVFVISDFLSQEYDIPLKRLARRHDVVAIWTGDRKEREAPQGGMFWLQDPETGQEVLVDTGSYAFRKWFEGFRTEVETDTQTALNASGVERLRITTEEDYGEAIVRFFRARGRRRK